MRTVLATAVCLTLATSALAQNRGLADIPGITGRGESGGSVVDLRGAGAKDTGTGFGLSRPLTRGGVAPVQLTAEELAVIERNYGRAADGAWYRKGEILMVSQGGYGETEARALGLTLKTRASLPGSGLMLSTFTAPDGAALETLVAQLRQARPSDAVDINHVYEYLNSAEARGEGQARNAAPGDGRAKVGAMIEAGLPASGPWLQGVTVKASRFTSGQGRPSDQASAVAAVFTAAAGREGLTLLVGDVAEDGPMPGASVSSIALAADWAVREGATVINIGVGGSPNQALAMVLGAIAGKGVSIVAAAGNDGPGSPAPYPAALPAVVAVTAVDSRGRVWSRATSGDHVDFAALGVDVPAAGHLWSGTSLAAPVVAGELLRSGQPASALNARARDLGAPGRDPVFGQGLIQTP